MAERSGIGLLGNECLDFGRHGGVSSGTVKQVPQGSDPGSIRRGNGRTFSLAPNGMKRLGYSGGLLAKEPFHVWWQRDGMW
ncbi:MAG: hypothetical protein RhofKO_06920 [Rhodothermales bacterium]